MTIWLLNSKWGCYGSLSNNIHDVVAQVCECGCDCCLSCSLSFVSGSVRLGFFFFLSAKCCEINPLNVAHLLILFRLT
jgi:hypothetical protein